MPAAVVAPLRRGRGGFRRSLPGPARRSRGTSCCRCSALYFVAGLSIICHFARKWFRARILRVGLYALVAYFPMNVGVALLGLFDWYVDFRRRGEEAIEETMKVILADDVRGLGHRGDTVTVKPGYARNFLFPQGARLRGDRRRTCAAWRREEEVRREDAPREGGRREAVAARSRG